ncbi:MAG: energy transducer TonB [Prevotella sp.]|jgi:TonB family protein|nr:energy transducer TonB [Prevotella sp.]
MKRQFILGMISILVLPVCAQVSSQAYSTFYQQEHVLYHSGEEMNVIDVNLEWPEYLNFSDEPVLQHYLSGQLFGLDADHFIEGYHHFLKLYGEPVEGLLETVPDDSRFCYITCKLHIIGYDPGRFISFVMSRKVEPAHLSSQEKKDTTELFTYDLIHHRILRTSDLIRMSRLTAGSEQARLFQYLLFSRLNERIPDDFSTNILVFESCLKKSGMLFDLCFKDLDGDTLKRTSEIAYPQLIPFESKVLRSILTSSPSSHLPSGLREESYLGSGEVDDQVDSVPRYIHGQGSITQDLARMITLTPEIIRNLTSHKVMVRFVVERDGSLSNIRILASGEPSLDREIVDALRQLPRWQPGKKGGKRVRSSVIIPVAVREYQ